MFPTSLTNNLTAAKTGNIMWPTEFMLRPINSVPPFAEWQTRKLTVLGRPNDLPPNLLYCSAAGLRARCPPPTFLIGSWYMSSSSNVANGVADPPPAETFPTPGAFLPLPPVWGAFFPLLVILDTVENVFTRHTMRDRQQQLLVYDFQDNSILCLTSESVPRTDSCDDQVPAMVASSGF